MLPNESVTEYSISYLSLNVNINPVVSTVTSAVKSPSTMSEAVAIDNQFGASSPR